MLLLAILWAAPLPPEANLLRFGERVPIDWFFSFWLPLTTPLPAALVWIVALSLVGILCFVPRLTRPQLHALPAPATVNERTCTGCEQCVKDCPYEAIEMIARARAVRCR